MMLSVRPDRSSAASQVLWFQAVSAGATSAGISFAVLQAATQALQPMHSVES